MKLSLSVSAAIFQMDMASRMSAFWILSELRMMKVVVVTTGAIRHAKLQ